jgi:hypothetical protein
MAALLVLPSRKAISAYAGKIAVYIQAKINSADFPARIYLMRLGYMFLSCCQTAIKHYFALDDKMPPDSAML